MGAQRMAAATVPGDTATVGPTAPAATAPEVTVAAATGQAATGQGAMAPPAMAAAMVGEATAPWAVCAAGCMAVVGMGAGWADTAGCLVECWDQARVVPLLVSYIPCSGGRRSAHESKLVMMNKTGYISAGAEMAVAAAVGA